MTTVRERGKKMTIERKNAKKWIPFSEISVGEIFEDEDGSLHMRVDERTFNDNRDVINAVSLEDAYIHRFYDDEMVSRIIAKLVVE